MAARVFAVIAALFLVGAFALAILGSPDMSLSQALYGLHRGLLGAAQDSVQQHMPGWISQHIVLPLLIRPAWLLPAAFGLIAIGGAITCFTGGSPRSHRRRS